MSSYDDCCLASPLKKEYPSSSTLISLGIKPNDILYSILL